MNKLMPPNCDYEDFKRNASQDKSITLSPGVYCSGLQLSGSDHVHLTPGVYYVDNGPFRINFRVELTGEDVGFYLADDVTSVTIKGGAKVSLSAARHKPMDGVLMTMAPGRSSLISASIGGTAELTLEGSVHLPTGKLKISGNSTTLSEATQIVAHSIKLSGNSKLRLQARFDEAGYPVRGQFASTVRLIK